MEKLDKDFYIKYNLPKGLTYENNTFSSLYHGTANKFDRFNLDLGGSFTGNNEIWSSILGRMDMYKHKLINHDDYKKVMSGKKTQIIEAVDFNITASDYEPDILHYQDIRNGVPVSVTTDYTGILSECPFGRVGDIISLWAEECRGIGKPRTTISVFAKITNIKLIMLQDISSSDVLANGYEDTPVSGSLSDFGVYQDVSNCGLSKLIRDWNMSNTHDKNWKDNPFVWAVDFTIDPDE